MKRFYERSDINEEIREFWDKEGKWTIFIFTHTSGKTFYCASENTGINVQIPENGAVEENYWLCDKWHSLEDALKIIRNFRAFV